jgi:hypothetical protein
VTARIAYLSGALPSGDANGLAAIVSDLINDPERVRAFVVLASASKVTQLVHDGSTVPTLQIRRIEPITDADDGREVSRLLMREYERRTGQLVLPLELERDVASAFELDPTDPPGDDPPPPPPPRRRGTKK